MNTSYKSSQCRKIAQTIIKAATAMGLKIVDTSSAGWSASEYIFIERGEDKSSLKVRVSDHDPRDSDSDVHVFVYPRQSDTLESLIRGIEKIAFLTANIIPEKYTRVAFEKRAEVAQKSAADKRKNKLSLEEEMKKAVVTELSKERLYNRVIAGKIIDRLFPNIPRAQRQRIADASSFTVEKIRRG